MKATKDANDWEKNRNERTISELRAKVDNLSQSKGLFFFYYCYYPLASSQLLMITILYATYGLLLLIKAKLFLFKSVRQINVLPYKVIIRALRYLG